MVVELGIHLGRELPAGLLHVLVEIVAVFIEGGLDEVKHHGAGAHRLLILTHHAGEAAAEDTRINNETNILAVEALHLLDKGEGSGLIEGHAGVDFHCHRHIILLTIGQQGLEHPVGHHGDKAEHTDAHLVCQAYLVDQQVDALAAGQIAVLVEVGVQKHIGDDGLKAGLSHGGVPLIQLFLGRMGRTLDHLVRQDLHALGAALLGVAHAAQKIHTVIEILILQAVQAHAGLNSAHVDRLLSKYAMTGSDRSLTL